MKKAKKIDGNILRLLAIFVIIIAVSGITKGTSFLNVGNLQSMAKTLTEYGLMAVGCGITMISGGIDLSTVYIANLCGIVAGLTMNESGSSIVVAIIVALIVGAACGIFNGFLVSVLKIPAMLATLGTYQLYMGIAIVASKGSTVSGVPTVYSSFASIRAAPKSSAVNASVSYSVFTWLDASCVTTTIPLSIAFFRDASIAPGSIGTTQLKNLVLM